MATKAQTTIAPNPQLVCWPVGTKFTTASGSAFYSIDDDADLQTLSRFKAAVESLKRLEIKHSVDRRSGDSPRLVRVPLRSLT